MRHHDIVGWDMLFWQVYPDDGQDTAVKRLISSGVDQCFYTSKELEAERDEYIKILSAPAALNGRKD